MAEIELVIKIDEEDYNIMKHNIAVNNPLCPISQEEMVFKVANGRLKPPIYKQMAIKALEQEPKTDEDYISRQAVLDINESHHGQMPNHINHQIWQEVKDLPSVQPKTAHWICLEDEYGDVVDAVCSNCNANGNPDYMHYCSNCGAKMESEIK